MTDPTASPSQGIAKTALVVGIITVALLALGSIWTMMTPGLAILSTSLISSIFVALTGLVGVIFGIIALVKRQRPALAVAGLVLSALPLLVALIGLGMFASLFAS